MNIVLPGEQLINTPNLEFKKSLFVKQIHKTEDNGQTKEFEFLNSKCSGVLSQQETNEVVSYVFRQICEKYTPSEGHRVIGRVVKKGMDGYEVDIKADRKAVLGALSFQGATKKSKPNLAESDLVFAQIQSIPGYLMYKLTCTSNTHTKIWNSGESMFGVLIDGYEMIVPLFLSYYLSQDDTIFKCIKDSLTIEVVIGINGVIWFKTKSTKNSIVIASMLREIAYMDKSQALDFVKSQKTKFI